MYVGLYFCIKLHKSLIVAQAKIYEDIHICVYVHIHMQCKEFVLIIYKYMDICKCECVKLVNHFKYTYVSVHLSTLISTKAYKWKIEKIKK